MTPLYAELAQTVPTQEIAKIKWAAYQFGKNWVKTGKSSTGNQSSPLWQI